MDAWLSQALLIHLSGFSIEQAFGLTIPQLNWSISTLSKIKEMENGTENNKNMGNTSNYEDPHINSNTLAMEGITKMLKERTGRKEFTLDEIEDPAGTIKKHNNGE